jgi:ferredoxin
MDAYDALMEKHGYSGSARYRKVMETLMTPIQAQIAVELPAPPEDLATKLNIGVDQVKTEIRDMFRKGVAIPKNFETMEGARFARVVTQLHDASEASYFVTEIFGDKLFKVWEDFSQNEWYPRYAQEYAQRENPIDRVIPAYKSIKGISGVTQFDDIREIVKAAELIATVPCSCRYQAHHTATILDSCLQFGRSAEYAITRKSGRKLSLDQAIEILDKVEDDGQVHMWVNAQMLSYGVMCNCTNDACIAWTPMLQHGVSVEKRAAKSRFEAVLDQESCTGCQDCVDRCQFDAITMTSVPGSKKLKAQIDAEKCWGCGVCVLKCAPESISMKLVRPLEHIPLQRAA